MSVVFTALTCRYRVQAWASSRLVVRISIQGMAAMLSTVVLTMVDAAAKMVAGRCQQSCKEVANGALIGTSGSSAEARPITLTFGFDVSGAQPNSLTSLAQSQQTTTTIPPSTSMIMTLDHAAAHLPAVLWIPAQLWGRVQLQHRLVEITGSALQLVKTVVVLIVAAMIP